MEKLDYESPDQAKHMASKPALSIVAFAVAGAFFLMSLASWHAGGFPGAWKRIVHCILVGMGACTASIGLATGWRSKPGVGMFFAVILNGVAFLFLTLYLIDWLASFFY